MLMNNQKQYVNTPTYTHEVLVPQHLDLSLAELRDLPKHKYHAHIEAIRLRGIELIENKCSPFGGMTECEIISNLRQLNDTIDVTVKQPPSVSGYSFAMENTNVNTSLQYNSNLTRGVNQWFFELWETRTSQNPLEQFNDADIFLKNLDVIIWNDRFKKYELNPDMRISRCISLLKTINGAKPAYNFPAALAKWIYLDAAKRLVNESDDFYILDPCMGFGGRLGGALASCNHYPLKNKTVHYCGTDVNSRTHHNFEKLFSYWQEHINPDIDFRLHKSLTPAERLLEDEFFNERQGKFDFAITSPPYFNCERYSLDEEQSYIQYPLYDRGGDKSWRRGFLKPMIQNVYHLLKDGGEFWLNIANIKSNRNILGLEYIDLEYDAKLFAIEAGFTHVRTYNMIMPNINSKPSVKSRTAISKSNNTIKPRKIIEINGKRFKYEPIFVFKKIILETQTL